MKFLVLLLFTLAFTSSSFNPIEKNIPVYKVVHGERFKIDFGGDIQSLKSCNLTKDYHDNHQRCSYVSQHHYFSGQCPRVKFTGNESRCHCYKTFFFVNEKETKYAKAIVLNMPFKQALQPSALICMAS
jgi:hypothetical protein